MTAAVWFCISVIAILFQPKITVFDCPLNLTLALVYAFGIRSASSLSAASSSDDVTPEIKSTLFGACIGLVEDALTGTMIGPNLLSKGLAGFISSVVYRDVFFSWESVLGGVVLGVLTLIDGFVVIGVRQLIPGQIVGGAAVFDIVVIQAVLNIPAGFLLKPGQKIGVSGFGWIRGRRYS